MPRDVEMQHPPTTVIDDEKAGEHAEGDRRNGKEIHGRNGFPMVAEKGKPSLRRLRVSGSALHPARNGSLGNIKTEHQKLSMDARCSPGWVLADHPEDQLPNLFRGLSSPDRLPDFGDQPPIQAKTSPVPPDYSFRGDNDEGLLPIRPDPPSNYPEEFIEEAEARSWTTTLQHDELLAQRKILDDDASMCAKEADECSEPKV